MAPTTEASAKKAGLGIPASMEERRRRQNQGGLHPRATFDAMPVQTVDAPWAALKRARLADIVAWSKPRASVI